MLDVGGALVGALCVSRKPASDALSSTSRIPDNSHEEQRRKENELQRAIAERNAKAELLASKQAITAANASSLADVRAVLDELKRAQTLQSQSLTRANTASAEEEMRRVLREHDSALLASKKAEEDLQRSLSESEAKLQLSNDERDTVRAELLTSKQAVAEANARASTALDAVQQLMGEVAAHLDATTKLQAQLLGQAPLDMSALAEASVAAHREAHNAEEGAEGAPPEARRGPATQILTPPGTPRIVLYSEGGGVFTPRLQPRIHTIASLNPRVPTPHHKQPRSACGKWMLYCGTKERASQRCENRRAPRCEHAAL